ncbi:MAG: hypothetical protein AMXMBFR13_20490 [Phycisphaerae bacterium]
MICALVLAAGRSRRMGTQKLLLPIPVPSTGSKNDALPSSGGADVSPSSSCGTDISLSSSSDTGVSPVASQDQHRHVKPMIAHIIDQVLTSPVEHVLVVVGADPRVPAALADRPLTLVANPEPEGDMLSSVRCGLRALPDGCDAVLVVLGDQPTVNPEVIAEMIRTFHETAHSIVVPVWQGTRGHPLLFSAAYREEILSDHDAVGLRGLLHAHPDQIHELDAADPAVLSDVDLPEDYEREVGSGQ